MLCVVYWAQFKTAKPLKKLRNYIGCTTDAVKREEEERGGGLLCPAWVKPAIAA